MHLSEPEKWYPPSFTVFCVGKHTSQGKSPAVQRMMVHPKNSQLDTGIARFESVDKMLEISPRTLVLGCKPQQLSELPLSIAEKTEDCLILSIMAGITLKRLQQSFPKAKNIVRSMPNTPGQIGEGATGYFFLKDPESEDAETIQSILSSLGQTHLLRKEDELDLVTAISGSGPAYLFEFTSALEEAAKEIGLDAQIAKELAIQTIIGSAKLMENSDFFS